MPVIINGSTGISGTDGSAATPAVQGTDTNTGMFFRLLTRSPSQKAASRQCGLMRAATWASGRLRRVLVLMWLALPA